MSEAAHGILNLYKPSGPTSHDCVSRVRRILRQRRIGHAGTLDPLASGVLLLGVGRGTRVLEYLQALPKVYRARLVLGLVTDTEDITGVPVAEADASAVTEAWFRSQLERFQGEILQVPPMVSALKVGGQRLYELARRGETIPRRPRKVTLYSVELLGFSPGVRAQAEFRMRCSAGTYVRTLCRDLGQALSTGAAMTALEREAVGSFLASEAVPLDEVRPTTPLIPLARALEHLPALLVNPDEAVRLAQGRFIPAPAGAPEGPVRVLNPDGTLLAIARARGRGEARLLAPEKVFAEQPEE